MWRFYVLGVALQDVFIYCWSSNGNITYLRLNCVGWKQPCFVVFIVKKKKISPTPSCFPAGSWLVCPMVCPMVSAFLLGAGWSALWFTLSLPSALVSETTARMPKETVPGPRSWDRTLSQFWEEDQDLLLSQDGSLRHQGHCQETGLYVTSTAQDQIKHEATCQKRIASN